MIDGISSSLPLIKAGKVKAMAVPAPTRDALLPDVPTLTELGYPHLEVLPFNAIFANAKTPRNITDKLDAAVRQVMSKPEVKAELESRGLTPTTLTSAQFQQRMAEESVRWQSVIKTAGITIE